MQNTTQIQNEPQRTCVENNIHATNEQESEQILKSLDYGQTSYSNIKNNSKEKMPSKRRKEEHSTKNEFLKIAKIQADSMSVSIIYYY